MWVFVIPELVITAIGLVIVLPAMAIGWLVDRRRKRHPQQRA
jgi:hypothetical protein